MGNQHFFWVIDLKGVFLANFHRKNESLPIEDIAKHLSIHYLNLPEIKFLV